MKDIEQIERTLALLEAKVDATAQLLSDVDEKIENVTVILDNLYDLFLVVNGLYETTKQLD